MTEIDYLPERNPDDILQILTTARPEALRDRARALTAAGHGPRVTYSRNIFIPLTRLCRDVCHYCTFAVTPRRTSRPYLSAEEIIAIAETGKAAGCREALFTLGDRPEARYATAREALAAMGESSTLSYLASMARRVLDETGLLPHLNPGLLGPEDYRALRPHSASMGMMLETASRRLSRPGMAHHGSPDKNPDRRLAAIEAAGHAAVPFTTGILIGIGETRRERIEALLALRDIHRRHGHIQEIIVQNFRAKPGTRMAGMAEPSVEDHAWTIAAARLIFGSGMTIQAPPNLHDPDALRILLDAGVNDWGGVSPVTIDHVNPEAPWPELDRLAEATARAGRDLRERLAIAPAFAAEPERWVAPDLVPYILRATDARGFARPDPWTPGADETVPAPPPATRAILPEFSRLLDRAAAGCGLDERGIVRLFEADGGEYAAIVRLADALRRKTCGDTVTFVVNRNINYTNICLHKCGFCAFSKGSTRSERGPAYQLDLDEIGRRTAEAWDRGATEVCLQGGIHPDYDGNFYLSVVEAVRRAAPDIHIHAFSPLEIRQGARSLGLPVEDYLARLKAAGLSSLPGTAAEILDDDIRALICPDKLDSDSWIDIVRTAHSVGLRTTATIMFGHVDRYPHWARHLLKIRNVQAETGGFTEFVPLPFVHMEAPIWRKGRARSGPTFREAVLMHAVARILFNDLIPHIQVSWVKMGAEGAAAALRAGCDDLGGILMDESITRAAGGRNGQTFGPGQMRALAASVGRDARQRTTFYQPVTTETPISWDCQS